MKSCRKASNMSPVLYVSRVEQTPPTDKGRANVRMCCEIDLIVVGFFRIISSVMYPSWSPYSTHCACSSLTLARKSGSINKRKATTAPIYEVCTKPSWPSGLMVMAAFSLE